MDVQFWWTCVFPQFDLQIQSHGAQFHRSKITRPTWLIPALLLHTLFPPWLIFPFPCLALRLQLDAISAKWSFVAGDDPLQGVIAVVGCFSIIPTLFSSELLLRSQECWHNLGINFFHFRTFSQNSMSGRLFQTKCLRHHFNSHSACTSMRVHTINVFMFTRGGGASWPCIVLGVFTAFPKTLYPL